MHLALNGRLIYTGGGQDGGDDDWVRKRGQRGMKGKDGKVFN